jgi:CHAD domain-containing protein
VELMFEIDPADVPRVLRAPALLACRQGRPRQAMANIIWHDTATGTLERLGLALGQGRSWRLERLYPETGPHAALDWLPAHGAKLIAQAETLPELEQLPEGLGSQLVPVAAFTGRRREYRLLHGGRAAEFGLLEGLLRGVAQDRPASYALLRGAPGAMAQLATELAELVALRVPRAGLAARAIAVGRGQPARARHLGAACVAPGMSVSEGLGAVIAQLGDAILHWAMLVPAASGPEPVHQMRVAVRRLRSALSLFRRAVADEAGGCAWLEDLAASLRALAGQLGQARDWDVFLTETGEAVSQAMGGDPRIAALIAAATRRQAAAYAALRGVLASPAWSRLELRLALLPTARPWDTRPEAAMPEHARPESAMISTDGPTSPARPEMSLRDYAAHALSRRLRHVLAPGPDLSGLPVERLHDTRKQAKQLRYGIEIFAPLFGEKAVRKYLPYLETVQEELGLLNDRAVAAQLMGQIEGGGRAFAAGVVMGYGAAGQARTLKRVDRAWSRFYRATPFWD